MNQNGYYRHAAIAGQTLVFVCEDDLWSVPREGGVARRLTDGAGEVTTPRLSPDGTLLAFVAREEGRPEVYVMASEGGSAKRLTFQGAEVCSISGWTPDGAAILFASDAGSPFVRETNGSHRARRRPPNPLGLGGMRSLALHADGRYVIGRNNDDPARWKRYRGGTAGDIWVDRDGTGEFSRLIKLNGNLCWPMWVGDRVFFLSDHEGIGNIYSVAPDGWDLQRHTHETEYFVRFPSTDGTTVALHGRRAGRPARRASGDVRRVRIEAPSPATANCAPFHRACRRSRAFRSEPRRHVACAGLARPGIHDAVMGRGRRRARRRKPRALPRDRVARGRRTLRVRQRRGRNRTARDPRRAGRKPRRDRDRGRHRARDRTRRLADGRHRRGRKPSPRTSLSRLALASRAHDRRQPGVARSTTSRSPRTAGGLRTASRRRPIRAPRRTPTRRSSASQRSSRAPFTTSRRCCAPIGRPHGIPTASTSTSFRRATSTRSTTRCNSI